MEFNIKPNEGPVDRAVRVGLGMVLAGAAYMKMVAPPLDLALYFVGAVMLLTGVTGFCGLYSLLGINTCPTGVKRKAKK